MDEVISTITSKGQMTLPKTIRNIMNLHSGDQVKFTIQSSDKVLMEKEEKGKRKQVLLNLISLLLKDCSLVVIKGKVGSGKTHLTQQLLINQLCNQKVAVIEPYIESYNQLKEHIADFTYLVTSKRNEIVPNVTQSNYELVVVDEAHQLEFGLIKDIYHQIKQKMILVSPSLPQHDLMELGSHISITVDKSGILIEKYELSDDGFKVLPIYID